jgi:hypothetical protein
VIFPKQDKWRYTSLNPTKPKSKGLIKNDKAESPIRPVVNWTSAPVYRPAKILVKILQAHVPLLYTFNVTNSTHLINDLADIPYKHNLRFTSFDISNIYSKIPTNELLSIIDTACNNNLVKKSLKQDLINLSKTIIDQNYLQFEGIT